MKINNHKLLNALYIINAISCVFIGVLHLITHFMEMVTDDVKAKIDYDITIASIESNIWSLWQGTSFMMGILLIIVGLLLLTIIFFSENLRLKLASSIVVVIMLILVIYSGVYFFSSFQIYGGVLGLLLQLTVIILILRRLKMND